MNWIFLLTLFSLSFAAKIRHSTKFTPTSFYFPCISWKWAYGGNVPGKSFEAGSNSEGAPIYLARLNIDSKYYLGSVVPRRNLALFLEADKMKEEHNYEVLTSVQGYWVQVENEIPAGAFQVA